MKLLKCLILAILMTLSISASAADFLKGRPTLFFFTNRNSPTCGNTDIQNTINSSSSGDTVTVPSGTCTWTGNVSISGKQLTVTAQGNLSGSTYTDNTHIIMAGHEVDLTVSTTNWVDISGFTFDGGNTGGLVQGGGPLLATNTHRIHNNHFILASPSRGIDMAMAVGVIYQNLFDTTAGGGGQQVWTVDGGSFSSNTDAGFPAWQVSPDPGLGSLSAEVIEDNIVNWQASADSIMDSYIGARWVVRHNIFNMTNCGNDFGGTHGTDSGGTRSPVSWELYNNTFINIGCGHLRAATFRGGYGVVHDNTFTGDYTNGITLMCYRCCNNLEHSNWNQCNGTSWLLKSNLPSSVWTTVTSGSNTFKFCSNNREKTCQTDPDCGGGGATCSGFFDGGNADGYICRDQPGTKPGQTVGGVYAWNNTPSSVDLGVFDGGQICNPTGHGAGASDNLTPWLNLGTNYFNDTQMPGYTPLAYPHPFRPASGVPNPPTSLTVTVK